MARIGLGDIGALTEVGSLTLASVNVGFQVVYLMLSQRRFARLVRQTRAACARTLCGGGAAAAERRLRAATLGCVACCTAVGVVWAAGPLLASSDALPYRLWSPLDVSAPAGYRLTYLLAVAILAPLVEAFVVLNALYLGLLALTSARFCSLSARLAAICSLGAAGSGRAAAAELARCVHQHALLLRFCRELSDALSPVLLSQFTFTIVIICQTALQASLEMSARTMKFMGLLGLGISELFLYSYMGHKIMSQASDVHMSAYSCGWPDLDSSFKKSITFIIQNAQQPLHFTIGKMYVLSLRTFIEMMRVSYAFFTLLQQVNDD